MYQRGVPSVLKALLQEISENYLGVTPIQSGDSVIINERSVHIRLNRLGQASRVEPR